MLIVVPPCACLGLYSIGFFSLDLRSLAPTLSCFFIFLVLPSLGLLSFGLPFLVFFRRSDVIRMLIVVPPVRVSVYTLSGFSLLIFALLLLPSFASSLALSVPLKVYLLSAFPLSFFWWCDALPMMIAVCPRACSAVLGYGFLSRLSYCTYKHVHIYIYMFNCKIQVRTYIYNCN